MGKIMTTDILIIGGGIAARRAATIASERYSVTLVSDGSGASAFIHGLNVPLLKEDSEELFLEDTLKSGKHQNSVELARTLVHGSLAVAREFGERFDKKEDGEFDLLKPLGSSVARVAGIGGRTGANVLGELSKEKKYEELTSTRALRLITDGKRVRGAMLFDKKSKTHFSVSARAVLVATGGFGGVFRFSTNSRDIGGDGAAMAFLAGAELVDMEFIQYEPTVALSPDALVGKSIITTMLFEGAVIRNAAGERFMDERVGKDALSLGIAREILQGGGTERGGVYFDMTGVPREMLLGKYKDYYDRYKRHGIDLFESPVEITPAPHTTMGGIRIDSECRTSVVGLFAAGEAAGGVHGANRLGGNAGLEVFVFGDAAGRALVRFLDEDPDVGSGVDDISLPDSFPDEEWDDAENRERLLAVCSEALGVIKNGDSLLKARQTVDKIITATKMAKHSFSAMRLFNDALTVKLVIEAALMRDSSVGAHVRSDAVEYTERYCVTQRLSDGELCIQRQEIK